MWLYQKHRLQQDKGRRSRQRREDCSRLRNTRLREAGCGGGEFGVLMGAVNPMVWRGFVVMATG
jgi:hypothetical protein